MLSQHNFDRGNPEVSLYYVLYSFILKTWSSSLHKKYEVDFDNFAKETKVGVAFCQRFRSGEAQIISVVSHFIHTNFCITCD
jgi:hypothetical protein